MHDDDEERFPRITLWELLGAVFRLIVNLSLWGPQGLFEPDHQKPEKKRPDGDTRADDAEPKPNRSRVPE